MRTKISELPITTNLNDEDILYVSQYDMNNDIFESKQISSQNLSKNINPPYQVIYLTQNGTSGTTSGTKGCTLIQDGEWEVTLFNSVYFVDDSLGNIQITIPDATTDNEGKIMIFVKPRLVQSDNQITIITQNNQNIAQTNQYKLISPNDRAELISVPFGANGSPQYKYRLTHAHSSIVGDIQVSSVGNQLFSDIKSAVDYANNFATRPVRIKVNPGTYEVNETIHVDCPYRMVIEGCGTNLSIITNGINLDQSPVFKLESACDIKKIKIISNDGFGSQNNEHAIDIDLLYEDEYIQFHNIEIIEFNIGININFNTVTPFRTWIFDSIINDCQTAIYTNNGALDISELSLFNNNIAVNILVTSNEDRFSIQNSIIYVDTGKTGIQYSNPSSFVQPYNFATSNSFFGSGTYISGFNFNIPSQVDFGYTNNLNLQEFKPNAFIEFNNNTTVTNIANTAVYYKAAGTNTGSSLGIKFQITNNRATYLPSVSRYIHIIATGDVTAASNNQTLRVALYQNGTTNLQEVDVRVITNGLGYGFAINKIIMVNQNDYFEIFVRNTSSTSNITLKDMGFSFISV
jgi:hypothetical protein